MSFGAIRRYDKNKRFWRVTKRTASLLLSAVNLQMQKQKNMIKIEPHLPKIL